MKLNDKARTLKKLRLQHSNVPKLKIYKNKEFLKNNYKVIHNIQNSFRSKIAIRSSSKSEDQSKRSNAGKFRSYLNVSLNNEKEIEQKILNVINSYKKDKKNGIFFVQEMVKNINISGVILTRSLENYIPSININYFKGDDSLNVTSGKKGSKSLIYFPNNKYNLNYKFQKLIKSVLELQEKVNEKDLDIEFIIDKKNKIHIVQVRKLIVPKNYKNLKTNHSSLLKNLDKKIIKLKKKHYSLLGDTTFFGVMPDWNPAEIIGLKPKPLALSLYKELVTDHIWAQNRKIYGYKDMSQFPLMTTFYGTPYIDVRIDFNSWLPNELPEKISKKLINFYLGLFKKNKHYHDKVEFEIVFTCMSINTQKKINLRLKNLLNTKEKKKFIKSLKNINKIAVFQIDQDIKLIKQLKKRQNQILNSKIYYLDKIYWLIEDCKKFGTLPFAGLARCAFIATEILNSFVEENIFSEKDKLNFLANIRTITSVMKDELLQGKSKFIHKYGHLRPGTYEITSLNYKENYNVYFGNLKKNLKKKVSKFKFTDLQKKKLIIL